MDLSSILDLPRRYHLLEVSLNLEGHTSTPIYRYSVFSGHPTPMFALAIGHPAHPDLKEEGSTSPLFDNESILSAPPD
jgi:hypothetical protein